jgi:hypothetical protein
MRSDGHGIVEEISCRYQIMMRWLFGRRLRDGLEKARRPVEKAVYSLLLSERIFKAKVCEPDNDTQLTFKTQPSCLNLAGLSQPR